MEAESIKYENLCIVGKYLAMYSLKIFLDHVNECKECNNVPILETDKKPEIHSE